MADSYHQPIFNLKSVVRETGVKGNTLRAWERRYGLPTPARTAGRHRLYSQRDIEITRDGLAVPVTTFSLTLGPFTDADGQPLTGAKVTITSTLGSKTATTNGDGYATFEGLEIGWKGLSIAITIEREGFDTKILPSKPVTANGTVELNMDELQVAKHAVTVKDDEEFPWWLVIVPIIVAIVAVLLLLLMLRRRKGPGAAPDYEPMEEEASGAWEEETGIVGALESESESEPGIDTDMDMGSDLEVTPPSFDTEAMEDEAAIAESEYESEFELDAEGASAFEDEFEEGAAPGPALASEFESEMDEASDSFAMDEEIDSDSEYESESEGEFAWDDGEYDLDSEPESESEFESEFELEGEFEEEESLTWDE